MNKKQKTDILRIALEALPGRLLDKYYGLNMLCRREEYDKARLISSLAHDILTEREQREWAATEKAKASIDSIEKEFGVRFAGGVLFVDIHDADEIPNTLHNIQPPPPNFDGTMPDDIPF